MNDYWSLLNVHEILLHFHFSSCKAENKKEKNKEMIIYFFFEYLIKSVRIIEFSKM